MSSELNKTKCCICHEFKTNGFLCGTCTSSLTCDTCFITWYKKDKVVLRAGSPPQYQNCSVCRQPLFDPYKIIRPTLRTAEQLIELSGANKTIVKGLSITLESEVITRLRSLVIQMVNDLHREIEDLIGCPSYVKVDEDDITQEGDILMQHWLENRAFLLYGELRSSFNLKCVWEKVVNEEETKKYIPLLKSLTAEFKPEHRRSELLERLTNIYLVFTMDSDIYYRRELKA